MKVIHLNFHYKNLLFFLVIIAYLLILEFIIVPYYMTWDTGSQFDKITALVLTSMWVSAFPLFFQFALKMFVSFRQKNQELALDNEGISLPEFYVHFWSLEMKKLVSIPYSQISYIKFADIPNPLFPQKIVSIVYAGPKGEKRIGFSDTQFSKGIVDYHLAFQFLKSKVKIEITDATLEK